MPATPKYGIGMRTFELNRNEAARRTMEYRVRAYKNSQSRVYPHEQRGVQTEGILPQTVKPTILRAVLHLKAVLVQWPVLRNSAVGKERVRENPEPFACRRLEAHAERGLIRR